MKSIYIYSFTNFLCFPFYFEDFVPIANVYTQSEEYYYTLQTYSDAMGEYDETPLVANYYRKMSVQFFSVNTINYGL